MKKIHLKEAKCELERMYADQGRLFKIDGKENEYIKYHITKKEGIS